MSPLAAALAACAGLAIGPLLWAQAVLNVASLDTPARTPGTPCDGPVLGDVSSQLPMDRSHPAIPARPRVPLKITVGPIESVTAVTFGALTLSTDQVLPLLAACWVAVVGVVLAVVDIKTHRLPNRLTALLSVGTLAFLGIEALARSASGQLLEAAASATGASIFYLLLRLLSRGGVGLGDAKLAFGLGLAVGWSGWRAVVSAVALGLLLTGLAAIVLILLRHANRSDALPHGPFMLLAALTALTGTP